MDVLQRVLVPRADQEALVSQSKERNKADRLFSLWVRSIGYCENCLRSNDVQLQCAHWISRRYSHTRTMEANAFCLCSGCHRWFTDHPTEFGRWAVDKRGEDTYQRVLKASRTRSKFNWKDEIERLKSLPPRADRRDTL